MRTGSPSRSRSQSPGQADGPQEIKRRTGVLSADRPFHDDDMDDDADDGPQFIGIKFCQEW